MALRSSTVVSVLLHAGLLTTAIVCSGVVARPGVQWAELQIELDQPELSATAEPKCEERVEVEPTVRDAEVEEPQVEPPSPDSVWPAEVAPPAKPRTTPPRQQVEWSTLGQQLVRRVRRPAPAPRPEQPPTAALPTPSARVLEVVPGRNPPPDYPRRARRERLEGTVTLLVTVAAAGNVIRCEVAISSGHELLDEAAARAVRRWQFDGGPGVVRIPVTFRLRG
ncbi:MAG: energy transducer TonB [Planctomycetes bacterium]|nr:energy transducer TonB [Planctomycetota bacterium]